MKRFDNGADGGHRQHPPDHRSFLDQFPTHSAGNTVFDASQYAFFGNDVVDEVELGGLGEEDDDNAAAVAFDDEAYMFAKKEVYFLRSPSDVDDLANDLTKINTRFNESREIGVSVDRVASSKNSYAPQLKQDDFNGWSAQQIFDGERTVDGMMWSSELFSSYANPVESQYLHRTSSYPQQEPLNLESISGYPLLVRGSSLTSYPPPGGREQFLLNSHEDHLNIPYRPETAAISRPNSSFSNSRCQGSKANLASHFSVNPSIRHAQKFSCQWEDQAGSFSSGNASFLSSSLQQSPSQNGAMNHILVQQQHSLHQIQPSHSHLTGMQGLSQNSHAYSAPYMLRNFDPMVLLADSGDQPHKLVQQGRQNVHNSRQSYELVGKRKENWWPLHKSKYMTTDELENILRMHLAATHSSDPYVDDYYYQASFAKKADGARFKRHFYPAHLRDIHPGSRANTETHAFLQVEALGRVPFSSIRRPRPLLEIDSPISVFVSHSEPKANDKPLEREPLLAARVAIENGLSLLLDVDDIDRFLLFNQLHDGGAHLKQRRQNLLKGVAVSLQLVDPLRINCQTAGLTSEDDLVFLRLVSLPKGQKFLACYIQHLLPGDELIRVVSIVILRHLRFLFGCLPTDPRAAETIASLARVVASSVTGLDLGALSACLAAVVCSSEQPPFRPMGSLAGDGASVILKSILQRATDLLTDPHASETCNVANRAEWQASFDEFFGILTTYCMNKYESVMQTVFMKNTPGSPFVAPDAARAISKEMPVDVLRATLPHTNEQQRKVLLEFAQRTMPVTEQVE